MKNTIKKCITCFTCLLTAMSFTTSILAASTPVFGGKYKQGVGNVTVYIDNASGAGYWEVYMKGGVNNWMYPGSGMSNPIYMQFVSSNYGSKMDFYCKPNSYWVSQGQGNYVLAETLFYDGNTRLYPSQNNTVCWEFTNIYINDDNFRSSSFSNEQAQGTVIHEMGHAFGLAHNNSNPYSIMCQTSSGRKVQSVQAIDDNAVNAKY